MKGTKYKKVTSVAKLSSFKFITMLKSIMKLNLLILAFRMSRIQSLNMDRVRSLTSGLQNGEQSIMSGNFYSEFYCILLVD